jgi:hypothetical protein
MNTAIERFAQSPLDHLGQRVITLAMMDEAHQRPEGAARKAFARNRGRLTEGRHYFTSGAESVLRTPLGAPNGSGSAPILLTERGYLVLVKTFRDDRAWQVQEDLVDGYFRARERQAGDPVVAMLVDEVRDLRNQMWGFFQGQLSAQARDTKQLATASEERFADLERQLKQLRRGSRVGAMGRAGGRDRKVKPRAPRPLTAAPAPLPLLGRAGAALGGEG